MTLGQRCLSPRGRLRAAGFSIVEITVVLVIMSVLIVICVPTYQDALEQSRADIATANLRAIWAAQRLYWLNMQTYSGDLSQLETLGLVDPAVVSGSSFYTYSISAADAHTFSASATRVGSGLWGGSFSVDQTGTISGTITGAGHNNIQPGFQ